MKVGIYNHAGQVVEVEYFQLLQWKGAINLEEQGLRHSRGSVTAHVKRILKCPRNYPRGVLLQYLKDSIKDIQEQLDETQQVQHQSHASS